LGRRVHHESLHCRVAQHAGRVGVLADLAIERTAAQVVQSVDYASGELSICESLWQSFNFRQQLVNQCFWEWTRVVDQNELLS